MAQLKHINIDRLKWVVRARVVALLDMALIFTGLLFLIFVIIGFASGLILNYEQDPITGDYPDTEFVTPNTTRFKWLFYSFILVIWIYLSLKLWVANKLRHSTDVEMYYAEAVKLSGAWWIVNCVFALVQIVFIVCFHFVYDITQSATSIVCFIIVLIIHLVFLWIVKRFRQELTNASGITSKNMCEVMTDIHRIIRRRVNADSREVSFA